MNASQIKAAAQRADKFGTEKAYIFSTWEVLLADGLEISLSQFKLALVAMNSRGELTLARADLVAAMDSFQVEKSETTYSNSLFHFIEL